MELLFVYISIYFCLFVNALKLFGWQLLLLTLYEHVIEMSFF